MHPNPTIPIPPHSHRCIIPIMRSRLRILLLLPLAALLACGSSANLPSSSSTSPNLSGDWVALATPTPIGSPPTTLPTPIAGFIGALQFTGNTAAGTFRAFDPSYPNPCVSPTQDLPVTGILDAANHLTLTVPISGGTATISATLPQNSQTYTIGNWQIVGGACAMPATVIAIVQFAPVTGTYTGILNVLDLTTRLPVPGSATTVSAVLTQSTTPNADGQFPLSGTVTATGACSGSFPIVNEVVFGGEITPSFLTGFSTTIFLGSVEPSGATLFGGFSSYSACGSQFYQGTLTRQ